MNLQILAAVLGFSANIPLLIGIYRDTIKQSFAAFMLWAMLDIIAAVTTIIEHGNYALPLAYAFSATIVAVSLAIKKQVQWSWIETSTTALVLTCIVVWYTAGEKTAIVASSLAVVVASIPQMVVTYQKPESTPAGIYVWFLVANLLSLAAGKAWTIEERLYSASGVVLTIVILTFSLRKVRDWPTFARTATALT